MNTKNLFNLQLFSEPNEDESKDDENLKDDESSKGNDDKGKTYTQSELDKALNTRAKNLESDFDKKIQSLVDEKVSKVLEREKSLSELSEDERAKREFELEKEEFYKQKNELDFNNLKNEMRDELKKENLPLEAVDLLVNRKDMTNEEAFKNVKSFKEILDVYVQQALQAKMNDSKLEIGNGDLSETSLDKFKTMGYVEKAKLFDKNPKLFKKLEAELLA